MYKTSMKGIKLQYIVHMYIHNRYFSHLQFIGKEKNTNNDNEVKSWLVWPAADPTKKETNGSDFKSFSKLFPFRHLLLLDRLCCMMIMMMMMGFNNKSRFFLGGFLRIE